MALQFVASNCAKETARIGYYSMICPRIEFPLAVTQFTRLQCDKINSPILRAVMSKMGYNCNMDRRVVYGPQTLGGSGFHDLLIEQGIQAITTLCGHLREPKSQTGDMMRTEIRWCQLHAGTDFDILALPQVPLEYVESCWIMHIREFAATYGLRIDLTDNPRQQLQCDHDCFLMDSFRDHGFSKAAMRRLHACRLYLRVQRLSDITEGDGQYLLQTALRGVRSYYESELVWPRQERPPTKWWKEWKRALLKVYSANGQLPNHPWANALTE